MLFCPSDIFPGRLPIPWTVPAFELISLCCQGLLHTDPQEDILEGRAISAMEERNCSL